MIWKWPWHPFLNPILWKYNQQIWWYDDEQCIEWSNEGKKYLEYSESPKDCDYFVYPKIFKLDNYNYIKCYIEKAKKYNKKVIIFSIDDMDIPYNFENTIVFRTSFSKWHKWEFWMPCFSKDLSKIIPREELNIHKNDSISIWYCGYTWYDSRKMKIIYNILFVRNLIFKNKFTKHFIFIFHIHKLYFYLIHAWLWRYYRQKMHKACLRIKKYKYNFIIRHTNLDPRNKDKAKEEYIKNIIDNDFPIVIRGSWNYSFRLYEVMSLWKIPIFIDTNCVLPFNDEIDYKNLFIWVPFEDIKNIEKYIDDYICKNENNIDDITKKIRDIYEKRLSMTWFYKHIIAKLSKNEYSIISS